MVESGVKTYLEGAHGGALMISGLWGSGKSYFVKNGLMDIIRHVDYHGQETDMTASAKIRELISKCVGLDNSKYFPVMVSVFGLSSVADIEKAIVNRWMDLVTNGLNKTVNSIKKTAKKLFERSNKLKDWYDFSGLLDYRPGISAITKNTVIIIDDLERFDDAISENEMLGFINNLCENMGFKVIVIANEEYLTGERKKLLTFKEKVVEKTLMFYPDTKAVASSIIKAYKDREFEEFMTKERILDSLDCHSAFAEKNPKYGRMLSNLRTIKFAINHFFPLLKALRRNTDIPAEATLDELLEFCWFSILNISLELKANNISCINLRGLDKFFYLESMRMNFEYEPQSEDSDLSTEGAEGDDNAGNDSDRNSEESSDSKYSRWFYEFYYNSRGIGLKPIASPQLLDYVVKGTAVDIPGLKNAYVADKDALRPRINEPDILLDEFMQKFATMGNEEIVDHLEKMLTFAEEGSFSELTSFINAAVYLTGFQELLTGKSINDINDSLIKGVDRWFSTHELGEIARSRFSAVKGSVDSSVIWLYGNISDKINARDDEKHKKLKEELIRMFSEDTREFCLRICPEGFSAPYNMLSNFYYRNPILDRITEDMLKEKVAKITLPDVFALDALAKNRYKNTGGGTLYDKEEDFWKKLDALMGEPVENPTAGSVMMTKILLPSVSELLNCRQNSPQPSAQSR